MRLLKITISALVLIAAVYYFTSGVPAHRAPRDSVTPPSQIVTREAIATKEFPNIEEVRAARAPQPAVSHPTAVVSEESSLSSATSPIGTMKNRGSASGMFAVESYLSAAHHADPQSLAALFEFYVDMPAATRSAYEALIPRLSANATKEAEGVTGVQLIEHQIYGPKDELVRLRLLRIDGTTNDESFLMRRTDAGWRRDMGVKAYLLSKSPVAK
jgi:hypothetical protein